MTNLEWLMQDKDMLAHLLAGDKHLRESTFCTDNLNCYAKGGNLCCEQCVVEWLDAEYEEPDTQEKIDADAEKDTCEYFPQCKEDCAEFDCHKEQRFDLLRRQRELDAMSVK